MKKIAILALAIVTTAVFTACNQTNAASKVKKENILEAQKRDNDIKKGAPIISFDRIEHDFGTVNEGTIVETTFVITNTGKSNLVVTDAQVTCGCTVPAWPKKPVAPGATAEVKVKFDTRGKTNKQSKSVTLFTNTEKGREVVILKGFVTPKNKQPNS